MRPFGTGGSERPPPRFGEPERLLHPDETVDRIRPFFAELGITRLSKQTGLDHIGIPCWASFRPNAASISTNQGKGLTDAAARASAIMEAVEFALAERPQVLCRTASANELTKAGASWLSPNRLLPIGHDLDPDRPISWVPGYRLISRDSTWVPFDLISMDAGRTELSGICKTTNGLAAGNTIEEAILHGVRELVESDATTLWSLRSADDQFGSAASANGSGDAALDGLLAAIDRAELRCALFDQTSDLEVPTFMALLGPRDAGAHSHFAICAGYASHPNEARAAIDAITEAAQGRITGATTKQIALELGLSPKTVAAYRARVLHKLGAKSSMQLSHMFHADGVDELSRAIRTPAQTSRRH